MKFSILSSGSKQNCFYIESENSAVLIDIGISYKVLLDFLYNVGGSFLKIKALFITHEHKDHVRGLKSFIKKCKVPVYINEISKQNLGFDLPNHCNLKNDEIISIGKLEICPFNVSHDAGNTYGYKIRENGRSIFLASDIGSFDERIINICKDSHAIAIESNYDMEMLRNSFYPDYLKKRIHGNNGHLSNNEALEFIKKTASSNTKNVFFLHISENNNSIAKIEEYIRDILMPHHPDVKFHISHREKPTPLINL